MVDVAFQNTGTGLFFIAQTLAMRNQKRPQPQTPRFFKKGPYFDSRLSHGHSVQVEARLYVIVSEPQFSVYAILNAGSLRALQVGPLVASRAVNLAALAMRFQMSSSPSLLLETD